jgi:medium-chain acyl-[acyl-carrier-protein] hydrolase
VHLSKKDVATSNPWFYVPVFKPKSEFRLFCFPYAGGSALLFRELGQLLGPRIELWGIEPPGRLSRIKEPPFSRMDELLAALGPNILGLLDKPFAFFGHSMGATIAFMFTRWLEERGHPQPVHLFLSARCAPHLTESNESLHGLTDDALIKRLLEFGAIPQLIVDEPELMELFLPVLRADFALAEDPSCNGVSPADVSITAFSGTDDAVIPPQQVDAWRAYTNRVFLHHTIEGDHFFLHSARDILIAHISKTLLSPGI